MCGITGIYYFKDTLENISAKVSDSTKLLQKRGPDGNGTYIRNNVGLGHARLAIIDTTQAAAQPFSDLADRYTIVFNGEFFNYNYHRNELMKKGIQFRSYSDTEVLLNLYKIYGSGCLEMINGFFALAIYDALEHTLFIARDRSGEKPLLYSIDNDKIVFASEMKALMAYNIAKEIDNESVLSYLQLNYIPAPHSIFKQVKKLMPGEYVIIKNGEVSINRYHTIIKATNQKINYEEAKEQLYALLSKAVERRLVSDVPLGAFLSGGIDSSIVVALAAENVKKLQTFSIGYKDNPFFDETEYANLVAKQFGTKHTVFMLSNADLLNNLHSALDYIDEPFADSSALAVHILSMHTQRQVTVALSGDGADEIFGGYHKHMAHYRALTRPVTNKLITSAIPFLAVLPQSRNNKISNTFRQMYRYGQGCILSDKERYWRWCSFTSENDARKLFNSEIQQHVYAERKVDILRHFDEDEEPDLNTVLLTDMNLVLANDMLTKVDMMSMANSLEVRSPFLDHTVFDFAFTLPSSFKVDDQMKKKILQDTFRHVLPESLYNRPKKGFEVPMLQWLKADLQNMLNEYVCNEQFIKQQGLFNYAEIQKLRHQLFSSNPGESHARMWGLLVFQYWYKKYISEN